MANFAATNEKPQSNASGKQHDLSSSACSLILLKPGTDGPPLFILPGGGGGKATNFSALVKHIKYCHAIYGIRLEDLERDMGAPQKPVEVLSKICLRVIEKQQSGGPYLLLGHSFGGLVLMDVACRLLGRRKKVALLGFMDTYPPQMYWPLRSWIRKLIRKAKYHVWTLTKIPPREAPIRVVRLGRGFLDHFRVRRGAVPHKWTDPNGANSSAVENANEAVGNWQRYRPRYYDDKITFFKSEHPTDTVACPPPTETLLIWQQFAKSIEMHLIPGGHVDVIIEHPEALAACISSCLDRATNQNDLADTDGARTSATDCQPHNSTPGGS